MNEAELLENANLAMSNGLAAFAIFVSMLAAYFTAAYIVGDKLDTRQLLIVNSIFIISMTGMTYVIFGFISIALDLYSEFQIMSDLPVFTPIKGFEIINIGINLLMIVAGLKFMMDRRSNVSGA